VIDPVIAFASYAGGGADETGMTIAVDAQGNTYLTGATASLNLPTAGALQTSLAGASDAFVLKLDPTGTRVLYATYIGGGGGEIGLGIAVDPTGNAYITGATTSANFPLVQPVQRVFGGGSPPFGTDAFALKLSPAGSALVYSTYLGGARGDAGRGIAVDPAGNAYIAGFTASADFPVRNAIQAVNRGGGSFNLDAFVAKLNPAGNGLVYSTYLGGGEGDLATTVAADAAGNAYVSGKTNSANFPLQSAFQSARRGAVDAFVSKLNPTGSALLYSTYLGGESFEIGASIAADSSGAAYLTGVTGSSDFPLRNAAQPRFGSPDLLGSDAFVAKFNPSGSDLVYSTYLGGSGTELGWGIAIGVDGSAYIAGETDSADFPVAGVVPDAAGGQNDSFIAKLNPAGSQFQYAALIGGAGNDTATGIGLDGSGDVYVGGSTFSGDFPVTLGAWQTGVRGRGDATLLKLTDGTPMPRVTSVSAAGLVIGAPVAPDSIASAFGRSLAPSTETAPGIPLPTTLAGVSLRLRDAAGADHAAPLYFVSQRQLNFLVPDAAATGLAGVSVLSGEQVVAVGTIRLENVAPSLFSANGNGRGVAAAFALRVTADGAQSQALIFQCASGACSAAPINLGPESDQVYLLLFGTGIRRRSGLGAVTATVGGLDVPVLFAAAQQSVGLDQVNIGPLPRALAARGQVDILLTVDGRRANTVTAAIQ